MSCVELPRKFKFFQLPGGLGSVTIVRKWRFLGLEGAVSVCVCSQNDGEVGKMQIIDFSSSEDY